MQSLSDDVALTASSAGVARFHAVHHHMDVVQPSIVSMSFEMFRQPDRGNKC